ncbi:MAG: AtpZ/AtpI family protein [Cytophagales bacterium]|nr:AtpZ/AtpI family protein [Bernardetiaceae bacterium]MDW8204587.1 AtpZ/AtpI family protein [Cytophagales bacterium]
MGSSKPQKQLNPYLRYSSMAFELAGALLLGYWVGRWIDREWLLPKSLGTMVSMMICLFAALFHILRNLMKSQS